MPDPNHFSAVGWVIIAVAAISTALLAIDALMRRYQGKSGERTITNTPLEVRASSQYVERAEFEKLVVANTQEHTNMFSKLGGVERGLRAEAKADNAELHEKINKVDREVGGITKGMEIQNQQLARIETTLTQMLRDGRQQALEEGRKHS